MSDIPYRCDAGHITQVVLPAAVVIKCYCGAAAEAQTEIRTVTVDITAVELEFEGKCISHIDVGVHATLAAECPTPQAMYDRLYDFVSGARVEPWEFDTMVDGSLIIVLTPPPKLADPMTQAKLPMPLTKPDVAQ